MKSIISILFFVLFGYSGFSQIKVEPNCWWVGMKNPGLQIMLHGDDIGGLKPQISYKGVKIKNVIQVENPNYLFIDLNIDARTLPGNFEISLLKDGEIQENVAYELKARRRESSERQSYSPADVIYLITPDRFANGDVGNDVVKGMNEMNIDRSNPNGRHGGDIQGVIDNLDYIKELGFTAVWLMPVLENDQKELSYHGYSITDFYKVDPRFGSNEQYVELSRLCKEKGLKLIIDVVLNHCGSEHWWMSDLPTKDWLNFQENKSFTNHRKTTLHDPHAAEKDSLQLVDGWFVETMPDMNQKNGLMANYLIQNCIWWVEYADLDGIRVDTYSYSDRYFLRSWSSRLMTEYPNLNIVGEEWNEDPAIVSYWQRGKVNYDGYTSSLPSLIDFPLQKAFNDGLIEEDNYNTGFIKPYEMLAKDFLYPEPDDLLIFPDNHDVERLYTQVGKDLDLFKIALTFYLTTRGIPQIFYGTEILLEGTSHGEARSDFPGGWNGDEVNGFIDQGLNEDQKEVKEFLQVLLKWRKANDVVANGKLGHFIPQDGVYVYFRYLESKRVMVILNKNNHPCSLEFSRYSSYIKDAKTGVNVLTGDKVRLQEKLDVAAKTPIVIEFEILK
ncbi:glycoside hydrolase family 13 protein [uncultured Draconibacterium sp.]|uniref:glycoside hydrolase family 13 protein n=1 Tax=uncultured Draconibacterium sp. TaxID=1573823 RepID=UPI002AA69CF4|nr:glycoside hydrolase family 13 protein [uncultured Draconibacterium sp.]